MLIVSPPPVKYHYYKALTTPCTEVPLELCGWCDRPAMHMHMHVARPKKAQSQVRSILRNSLKKVAKKSYHFLAVVV